MAQIEEHVDQQPAVNADAPQTRPPQIQIDDSKVIAAYSNFCRDGKGDITDIVRMGKA